MFDIGFAEMVMLGLIALVVIGPKQLPGLVRTLGLWVGKGRRILNEVKVDIQKEIDEQDMQNLREAKQQLDRMNQNLDARNLNESTRADTADSPSETDKNHATAKTTTTSNR